MNKLHIKIAYVDDDEDVIFGALAEIKRETEKKQYTDMNVQIDFEKIKEEKTQEEFWLRIINQDYHGMILDYRLVDSGIFKDASFIWEHIKKRNPLFPLAIYTSNKEEVKIHQDAEMIFSKGSMEETNKMIDYIIMQIKHNLYTIETLERVNTGLKEEGTVSPVVLMNEKDIDKQFSLFFEKDNTEETEREFKELIGKAYEIINKYNNDGE